MKKIATKRGDKSPLILAARKPFILLTILTLILTCPSWAALGDSEQSIQRDAVRLKGERRVVSTTPYVLHEIQTPGGYTVREFVSPGGTVFAVSWSGPGGIDLQSLLDAYFNNFQQGMAQQQHRARGPILLNTPGLVLEQAGHMRAIHGRAYVPQLVPSTMDLNEIR